jgi:hypothetical protein
VAVNGVRSQINAQNMNRSLLDGSFQGPAILYHAFNANIIRGICHSLGNSPCTIMLAALFASIDAKSQSFFSPAKPTSNRKLGSKDARCADSFS